MTKPLSEDLLTGANAIAEYLGWPVRRVYWAAEKGSIPIDRVGVMLVARKSRLDRIGMGSEVAA